MRTRGRSHVPDQITMLAHFMDLAAGRHLQTTPSCSCVLQLKLRQACHSTMHVYVCRIDWHCQTPPCLWFCL